MARYLETKIVLSAGQAAGTEAILAAEPGSGAGNRVAVVFGNPNATMCNLHLSDSETHGTGLPVAGYSTASFNRDLPGLGNALYVTGLTAGNVVVIWEA
ncbi:hypothetical protein JessAGP_051c [Caulobacter phage Jess A]|nr:hypothetical protein JessAGP_051c [Caulobacter phage Jess A]WCA46461.1 hypothetical protein [Caulobacter phage RapA]